MTGKWAIIQKSYPSPWGSTVHGKVPLRDERGDFTFYYSEADNGWHSDLEHATIYGSREDAERVAFSIVTREPSHVGCVSVEPLSS